MNKKLILATSLLATTVLATNAQAIQFGKPFTAKALISSPSRQLGNGPQTKDVTVMSIKLSAKEQQALFAARPHSTTRAESDSNLPPSMNLGMNGTPVLDQGRHGSCVTFAITGAIDAILGKGDYVSQLCNLELGNTLEGSGYLPSGWDGSLGPWVIEQTMQFGIVSKANQTSKSCAGVTDYPLADMTDSGNAMTVTDFKQMSEDLSNTMYSVYHMNWMQRDGSRYSDAAQEDQVLTQVKEGIVKGHRSTFGVFLIIPPGCSVGACATHNSKFDTWALTKDIENPPFETGGHEMIITGYDDKAVAYDSEGKRHEGLLTLRNSWGDDVGDHGNYYMSYEYFKKYVGEVQEMVDIEE